MKGKIRVAIVTTVLVFSMFSIAVALLPPDQAQKVSVVFQGMTSVALLAVTATYVVFTRQLVQAQLDPTSALRIESEQRVVAELLAAVIRSSGAFTAIQSSYPVKSERNVPPAPINEVAWAEWNELSLALEARFAQAPVQLMEDCMVAHATLIRAALETACLQQALGLESQRSKVEHREWNYEKAREWFDDECWPSSEPNKPDFDRLAAGSAVDRAAKKVRELYVALQRYLSSGGFR